MTIKWDECFERVKVPQKESAKEFYPLLSCSLNSVRMRDRGRAECVGKQFTWQPVSCLLTVEGEKPTALCGEKNPPLTLLPEEIEFKFHGRCFLNKSVIPTPTSAAEQRNLSRICSFFFFSWVFGFRGHVGT